MQGKRHVNFQMPGLWNFYLQIPSQNYNKFSLYHPVPLTQQSICKYKWITEWLVLVVSNSTAYHYQKAAWRLYKNHATNQTGLVLFFVWNSKYGKHLFFNNV